MGNFFTTDYQLHREADTNHDGVVTREEFEAWKRSQAQTDQQQRSDLQKEIDALCEVNRQLERQLLEARQRPPQEIQATGQLDAASKERIEEIVERLLQNADVNIRLLPDAVERHIYRNMFRLLLSVIAELVESSSVQFMGHDIQLQLVPTPRRQESQGGLRGGAESQEQEQNSSESDSESEEARSEGRTHRIKHYFHR